MLVELIGRHYRLEDVLRALDKAGYVAPAAPGIYPADEVESLRWQLERANNAIATLHSSQQLRDKVAGVLDASPKGGITADAIREAFPLFDEAGLDEKEHCCESAMQHDRKRLHAMLQATSAEVGA